MDELGTENRRERRWIVLIVILLAAAIAFILWLFLKSDNSQNTTSQNSPPSKTTPAKNDINSLISYQLPADWTTVSCSNPGEVILIVPSQRVSPACAELSESWPMKILMDSQNITDCNQIKVNNQQITNHVCSSQSVNGSKIFISSTTYNDKSPYGRNVKVSDYYVQTSKGVVKLEYADDLTSSNDDYQSDFDKIANTIKVK